jgi:DNA primase
MPRIPEETIERLKQEVSLERLATARGVKLARHGTDLIGLCPFHDDREPSLVISPKKNLWHCLGACQTGGTVIDWVMKAEGVSFRHAVELLRADVPVGESPVVKVASVSQAAGSGGSRGRRRGNAERGGGFLSRDAEAVTGNIAVKSRAVLS